MYNHRRSSTALLFAKSIKVSSDPREKKAVLGSRMRKAIYESSKNNSLIIWNSVSAYQTKILESQTIGKKSIVSKMSI